MVKKKEMVDIKEYLSDKLKLYGVIDICQKDWFYYFEGWKEDDFGIEICYEIRIRVELSEEENWRKFKKPYKIEIMLSSDQDDEWRSVN